MPVIIDGIAGTNVMLIAAPVRNRNTKVITKLYYTQNGITGHGTPLRKTKAEALKDAGIDPDIAEE